MVAAAAAGLATAGPVGPLAPAAPVGPFWGSEVVIDSGAVAAFDATSDSSGVIWAAIAYPDNAVGLYFSTDYGSTWQGRWAMRADSAVRQVQLLAGQGDSSFLYLFMLQAGNGGDLWLARVRMDSAGDNVVPVAVGPDTIDDFSATLDRDGRYYLYCLYANEHRTGRTGTFTRSLDYGKSWESGTDWWNAWDPCISHTSGSVIHCVWRYALAAGEVHYSFNRHYGMSGYWSGYRIVSSEADNCFDPVVVQADSSPGSQAAVWVFYTVGRRGTATLDLQYSASWDGGWNWAQGQPFGNPLRDEQQPDLAADRSRPNDYVGLCYTSGNRASGETTAVWWSCANSLALTEWLDPVKVSRVPVAALPPRIIYAPHAPLRLPAVLYSEQSEAGPLGVRFAAPWFSTPQTPSPGSESPATSLWPNPSAGAVRFSATLTEPGSYSLCVYEASGRLVTDLFRGWQTAGQQSWTWNRKSSDGRRMPTGTYFLRLNGPRTVISRRLVLF